VSPQTLGSIAGGAQGANGQVRLSYSTGAPTVLLSAAAAAFTDQFGNAIPMGINTSFNMTVADVLTNLLDLADQGSDPGSLAGTSVLWSKSGQLKYFSTDGTKYNTGHFVSSSDSDELVNSTVFANICGGGATVEAGIKYRVHAELTVVQGPNVAADDFRLGFTGTITEVRMKAVFQQDNTSSFVATTTTNNGLLPSHAYGAGTTYVATLHGIIKPSSTGTLSIQAAMSAAGDTFTVLALSDFHLEPVN
jgi:hypothetical protein